MYEVRFHLGAGKNYLSWQVRTKKNRGNVAYYNPTEHQLELVGCKLINRVNKAKQVYDAGVKDVSGWVECEDVIVSDSIPVDNLERLYYNPIRDVHWRRESDCGEFTWDNSHYASLITNNRQLYILEERT